MALTSKEAQHIRDLTVSHNELMMRVEHLEKVIVALYQLMPGFLQRGMKKDGVAPRPVGPNRPLNHTRIDSTPEPIMVNWDTRIHGVKPGQIDRPIPLDKRRSLELDMGENDDFG